MENTLPSKDEIDAIIKRFQGLVNEETAILIWQKEHGLYQPPPQPADPNCQRLKYEGYNVKQGSKGEYFLLKFNKPILDSGYDTINLFNRKILGELKVGQWYDVHFVKDKSGRFYNISYVESAPEPTENPSQYEVPSPKAINTTSPKAESVQKTNSEIKPATESRKPYYSMSREELEGEWKLTTNGAISGHLDNLILMNDQYSMLNQIKIAIETQTKILSKISEQLDSVMAGMRGGESRLKEEIKDEMSKIKKEISQIIGDNKAKKEK